jgi:cytochrome P450 family 4
MGVKLSDVDGSQTYRNNIYEIGKLLIHRFTRPILANEHIWAWLGHKKALSKLLVPVHKFTLDIIKERRDKFFSNNSELHVDENM